MIIFYDLLIVLFFVGFNVEQVGLLEPFFEIWERIDVNIFKL